MSFHKIIADVILSHIGDYVTILHYKKQQFLPSPPRQQKDSELPVRFFDGAGMMHGDIFKA